MPVILRWHDKENVLSNDWLVNSVRFHTVKNFEYGDGVRADTVVIAVMADGDQLRKIIDDNGKENIPTSILGLKVFPLLPNIIHWTWRYGTIRTEYNRFEIFPEGTEYGA